jgi:hypothetical protein
MSDSFLHFCITLTSVTTQTLFQTAKEIKVLATTTTHNLMDSRLFAAISMECVEHSTYSPELTTRHFHHFSPPKQHLGGHMLQNVVEVQKAILQWSC